MIEGNHPTLSILLDESSPAEAPVSLSNRPKRCLVAERTGSKACRELSGVSTMEEDNFCALNMADRDRIRRKVMEALKRRGWDEGSMRQDTSFVLETDEGEFQIPIEILVFLAETPALLVKCVRGNMATRERPSLSLARLIAEQPIPFAIVATERDAVVFDTMSGKVLGRGYGAFPRLEEAKQKLLESVASRVPPEQQERERRILHTYYHLRCSVEMEPF
jgi:hypothetical protein